MALAGYPYENMIGDNVQPIGRTPQLQVGNITSLSNYFLLPTDAGQRHLVQHNLPMAGGASGSPVIDAAGQVVAIGSAGNGFMVNGQRIPNAALVNYAQRADALTDLLDGTAEAHIQADRTYWAKQTAAFKRGVDVLIPLILEQKKPQDSSKATLAAEYKGSTTARDRISDPGKTPFRMKTYSAPLKPISQHVFIAYAQNGAPIASLFVSVGGKIVVHADGQGDQYAFATFTAPASGGSATLVVATPDQDTSFLLRGYVWQSAPS